MVIDIEANATASKVRKQSSGFEPFSYHLLKENFEDNDEEDEFFK